MYDYEELTNIIEKFEDWIEADMRENGIGFECAMQRLLSVVRDRLESR